MKIFLRLILIVAVLATTSCGKKIIIVDQSPKSGKSTAPGQIKKQTGSQSAKQYAPGQVKKETGSQSAKSVAPGQKKKQN